MFDSISNIFSLPRNQSHKYKIQPSLNQHLQAHHNTANKRQPPSDPLFDSLVEHLTQPLEQWILHQESHLKSMKVHRLIYQLVIENSSRSKLKGPFRITVHNLFVLVVQYEVLSEFIKHMSMTQLQLFLDGSAGILLKNDNDPMEQLTCAIHHVLTKCQIHRGDKSLPILTRPLNIHNIPNFLNIYGKLPEPLGTTFYDSVVRVIPMVVELLKLVVRTNYKPNRHQILDYLPWTYDIGNKLLALIEDNISQVVEAGQPIKDDKCEKAENPELKKRLMQQATKVFNSGFISAKELFTHACREIYYFQHIFRLHKFISQLTHQSEDVYASHQNYNIKLVSNYLRLSISYDVNIPHLCFQCISKILSLMRLEFAQDVQLIMPIKEQTFKNSIKAIQECSLYQWPKVGRSNNQKTDHPQFFLDKEQNSLLIHLLRLILSLQIEYIPVLTNLLKLLQKPFLHQAQLFLIKNNFLHFLLEEQINLEGEDKKMNQQYFQTVSLIMKNNTFAYCVFDELLARDYDKGKRCIFEEEIRKHFYSAKRWLLHIIADVIHFNNKHKGEQYFLPFALQLLLYPKNADSTKHCIWISYIHDVIIRELASKQEKLIKLGRADADIERDINEWITLAILFQVEYVLQKKGQYIELGQFTMNYMTPILKEAIKWKHQSETAVMQRILKNHQQWEAYYTEVILNKENNQDLLEQQLGPTVSFLFLKRWNRKISNTIQLFIDSVQSTIVDPKVPLYQ